MSIRTMLVTGGIALAALAVASRIPMLRALVLGAPTTSA